MSGDDTPASVLSTSSGSRSPVRGLDTNTTPSPSGASKPLTFNPRALSHKLAMIEASQALAQASATLSIAAQAMSKAAASLAVMSEHSNEDYDFGVGNPSYVEGWSASPEWAQSSYNLPPVATIPTDTSMYAIEEGYNVAQLREAPSRETNLVASPQECLSGVKSSADVLASVPAIVCESQSSATQETMMQSSPEVSASQCTPSVPSDATNLAKEPTIPTEPVVPKVDLPPKGDVATKSKSNTVAGGAPPAAQAKVSVPISNVAPASSKQVSGSNTSSRQPTDSNTQHNASPIAPGKAGNLPSTTCIILERGLDLLPTLCHIAKRCPRTVCLYNYSGLTAVISVGVMLKANIKLPVIMPASTKHDKLAAAVNKFKSSQSGILLWPGCIKLHEITDLAASSDIQLIQLGRPIQTIAATKCWNTTVVISNSDLAQPQAAQYRDYLKDPQSEVCNLQGANSPLRPFREWLRSRLSHDSYARGLYWDWYLYNRSRNPKQSAIDTLKLANKYAEEFLLRGENKQYGEPVGGKVPITEGIVKNQKLEAAVQMGIVLVA